MLHALLDLPLHLFLLLVALPTLLDVKAKENQLGNEEGSSAFQMPLLLALLLTFLDAICLYY